MPSVPSDPPASESAVDMADLKRKSVRGGMVTFASQGITVGIQLTSMVVLSRLLSPDDYGIMAMVMAITAFAGLFRDLGLSAAAIQKGSLSHAQMSNLFWLNVGMGALLTAALASASPLVARFFDKPELAPLTLLFSFTFLIGSLGTQHGALMQRELQFGCRAVTGISGAITGLVISIALALRGHGYWALAWGSLVGSAVTTILLFALSSFRPGLWTRGAGMRSMLKFGADVTVFDFVNYFQRNLDNLLIGKFWGADALGFYSRAYQLLMFPINNLRGPINTVAFPALSRLQDQPEEFRAYYLKVTSLLAFLSMPLTAFLFIASSPIIEIVLGKEWLKVSPIFSWLAIAAFIQPASGFAGSLLLSLGQGRRYIQCGLFNAVLLSLCFMFGVKWGGVEVAAAYAIGNYIVLYPWLSWAFKQSPVSFSDFARACSFPAFFSFLAAAVGMMVQSHLVRLHPFVQVMIYLIEFSMIIGAMVCFTKAGRIFISMAMGIVREFRLKSA